MRFKPDVIVRLFLAALLLLAACSKKTPKPEPASAQKRTEESAPAASAPKAAASADEADRLYEQRWKALLADSRRRAGQAGQLYNKGRAEEGEALFESVLGELRDSPYDFPGHPQVERTYYQILRRFQDLQLAHMSSGDDFPGLDEQVPPQETTPLEEADDVNLYAIEVDPELRDLVHKELLNARFDLPVVLNGSVLKALEFHTERSRKSIEVGLRRVGRFRPLFEQAFEEAGVPKDLIYMSYIESLFNPRAYSRAHARGLWQFMTPTARDFGMRVDWWIDERSDVEKSTFAAARYLRQLYDQFGDWYLALAAYNGGQGRLERILKRHGQMDFWELSRRRLLPRQTRNFVPLILATIIVFNSPQRFDFEVEPDPPRNVEKVAVPHQIDLGKIAQLVGMTRQELADLNPELRRGVTPFEMDGYQLKVPAGWADGLGSKLAALPPEERVQFARHRVRQGETLGQIARRYGTSVRAIAQLNRIRNVHRISLNQNLLIPVNQPQAPSRASVRSAPASGEHVVSRGDTLYRIARLYQIALKDLLRWNDLTRASVIYPGQLLRVTGAGQDDGH
ncbi:MAG TPA: LysM peptidoglycan-binding domain-containing protein [Acidobacteriota bacterium]|nr:LysM peptidoglycan-binding domain-containing protein [Acidobacteriota bacterium]